VDSASIYYQIWRQSFVETARHTAILAEAQSSGLYVSDDAVDEALIHYGPYQENGQFSEARYRRASAAEKFATRQLYREQLTQDRFINDALYGVLANKAEKDKLSLGASPERSFSYVAYSFSEYPQEKVVEYGAANAAKFTRIKLSRILIKTGKNEADSAKSRLVADPLRFEEIAKASSKDSYASGGGAMGWQYRHDLELDFDKTEPVDTILALRQGEISEPIEGKFGWMIFRCDEAAIPIDMGLEEDRQAVRTYLERYEAGLVQDYFLQEAKDFVSRARQDGFTKTAAAEGLTIDVSTFFPMNYQNAFVWKPVRSETQTASDTNAPLSEALYSEEFFTAAFSIRQGEVSEPVVVGSYVVVLSLRAERDVPQSEIETMDQYFEYLAQQATAADLDAQLRDPEKLTDKFDETYLQYVAPSSTGS
jgi:parvulin-like peptidyl-prolyl isomerase